MAETITASVGAGGINRFDDVETIQALLNQVPGTDGGPKPLLDVDGIVGPLTIGAIRGFQKKHFGWQDGRVDVNQQTHQKLNLFDLIPATGNPVRFQPILANNGFDHFDLREPPFQMVPEGGTRKLRIVNGADPGLQVDHFTANNPKVASAVLSGQSVVITGLRPGRTLLKARNAAGRVLTRLDVAVKKLIVRRIAFFFVHDKIRGTTRTKSKLDKDFATVDDLILALNRIYEPQANVRFEAGQIQDPLTFDKHDFGDEVNFPTEWDVVVAKRDPGAHFSVFFVNEFEQDDDLATDLPDGGAIKSDKSCLVDDSLKRQRKLDKVIAHETGHLFGLDKDIPPFTVHNADSNNLMHDKDDASLGLSKKQINHVNK